MCFDGVPHPANISAHGVYSAVNQLCSFQILVLLLALSKSETPTLTAKVWLTDQERQCWDGFLQLCRRGNMQLHVPRSCTSIGFPSQVRDRRLLASDRRTNMTTTGAAAKTCIVGLGDPIVDVLVKVSSQEFDQLGLQRGGSVSLHQKDIDGLLEQVTDDGHRTK